MRRDRGNDHLLELIGRVYAAVEDGSMWPELLGGLAATIDAEGAVLIVRPHTADGLALNITHSIDAAGTHAYGAHYWRDDVWVRNSTNLPAGTSVTSEALLPSRQLRRTEFFNDFLHPYGLDHMCGAILENSAALWAHLSLLRCDRSGPFSREEMRRLGIVAPHFRRALRLQGDLGRVLEERQALDFALDGLEVGVGLLDGRGRPVFFNSALESILAQNDGLAAAAAGLVCGLSGETAALRRLIADALAMPVGAGRAAGGALAVSRRSGRRPYAVQVGPSPARGDGSLSPWATVAAVVLVRDPERVPRPAADVLRALYGLTPAEARLAVALAGGGSLKAHAEQAGVTLGTARNQLKSLFVKTGTHRQAELVHLLHAAPPL